ncbi:Alpha/Beta hydrolase protein [Chlamydoabsidia padenii]|nr:Alpha/Beta hydrolase protein [Chlamydoabsidia padenii]
MTSSIRLFHHDQPVEVTTNDTTTPLSFVDYITSSCPSLSGTYTPTPYLFNGHLQTIYSSYYKYTSPQVNYEREMITMNDGAQVALDWTVSEKQLGDDSKTPVLVVLHGLTGGSHESYIHGVLEKIIVAPHYYRGVIMHSRGCGFTEITTPQTINGANTNDLRQTLIHIRNKLAPGTPLVGIGFSLGSNILVKYLGEEKENSLLQGGISVGNPFDVLACVNYLDSTYLRRKIYSGTMANSLKKVFIRHMAMMKKHPDVITEDVLSAMTIRDYDNACTKKVYGYSTSNNYYRDGSSSRFVEHVRVPLVCVNSLDDPVANPLGIPWDEIKVNPYVLLTTTDYGGHLAWFESLLTPSRWIDRRLAEITVALLKAYRY